MTIGSDPLSTATSHYRGGTLAMARHNYSAAAVEFAIAIRQHPEFAQGYYQLGKALLAKKTTRDAFAAFSAAVALDADFVDAQVALRGLYLAAAKTGSYGEIADRYDPNSTRASELLRANDHAEARPPWVSSAEPSSPTAAPGSGRLGGVASDAFQRSVAVHTAPAPTLGQPATTDEGSAKTISGSSVTGSLATTGAVSVPNRGLPAPPPTPVQVQGALGNILTTIDPQRFAGGVSASAFRRIHLDNNHTDWGTRINSADAELGTSPGIIEIAGGGAFSTTAVISANHVLLIDAGIYKNTCAGPMLTPKSNSAIIGSGWNTVLMESTAAGSWVVIAPFNSHRDNYLGDRNIHIANFQIKGANPHFFSAPPAIALGNLAVGSVQDVWMNATRSIGVQAGGGSAYGNFADTVRISNCLFTHVASQNLAVVNGRNITLQNNVFRDPGQPGGPGSSPIDLEPNMGTDILDNIEIIGNVVDHRGSSVCCGNGIIVYGSPSPLTKHPVIVRDNVLIGGDTGPIPTNHMANGIYLINARNVEVAHNTIRRTGQSGIYLSGATQVVVSNNTLVQVGGGGLVGFSVANTTHSRIAGNVIEMQASGGGSADTRIVESGSSDYNIYLNNVAGSITSIGPHNRLSGNTTGDAPAPGPTRVASAPTAGRILSASAAGRTTVAGRPPHNAQTALSGGSGSAAAMGRLIGSQVADSLPPPAPSLSQPSTPTRSIAKLILKSLDSKNTLLTPLEMATLFDYVVVHAEDADTARQIKSLNPIVPVLLYQAPHYTETWQGDWSTLNEHEAWFLHDPAGRRAHIGATQYLMDLRNPQFRAYQIKHIMELINAYGFDGLLWDGPPGAIVSNLGLSPGPDPEAVSTWHADVLTFLKEMRLALGTKWLVTKSTPSYDTGVSDMDDTDYLPYVDGTELEGFGHSPLSSPTDPPNGWAWQQRMAHRNLSAGKLLLASTGLQLPASPEQIHHWQMFTFVSALLWADGMHVYYDWTTSGTPEAVTFPEMYIPLGYPLGASYWRDGVTQRDFTGAQVVVNASGSAVTINLPIGLHTLDGSVYTQRSPRVTVAPWSALILLRD